MTHFPSLPSGAHLSELFRRFPKGAEPLLRLHDALLRAESEFSVAERELIATYVSGLNQCGFCYGAHTLMARAFGVEAGVLEALLGEPEPAAAGPAMTPVLQYVRKLTQTPSRITASDAGAVFAAGWSEDALYDAISICALYNYMNRVLDSAGITPGPEYVQPTESDMERRRGSTYMDWGRMIGVVGPAD